MEESGSTVIPGTAATAAGGRHDQRGEIERTIGMTDPLYGLAVVIALLVVYELVRRSR